MPAKADGCQCAEQALTRSLGVMHGTDALFAVGERNCKGRAKGRTGSSREAGTSRTAYRPMHVFSVEVAMAIHGILWVGYATGGNV